MQHARQSLRILALAALAVLVWQFWLRGIARPALAETNYHANRLRLEAWFLDPLPADVLAGSSISGRLLPEYFAGTSLTGIANLGLDGSGPLTALDCVLRRLTNVATVPPPRRVFVEVHRLDRPVDANDRLLLAAADDTGMTLGRLLPATRAASRPTTVAYAWLKEHQRGQAGQQPLPGGDPREVSGAESWFTALAARVSRLRALGVEVVLLRLPVGRENPGSAEAPNFADAAAGRLGVPLVDLHRTSVRKGLSLKYSDGLHLTPESARQVARELALAVP